jgi:hypothetical protein
MDFLLKYNKKLKGMNSEAIVEYYLEFDEKNEQIEKMLEDVNNITDLYIFAKTYNKRLIILKIEMRRRRIEEIYMNLERYKDLEDVNKIKKYLIKNGFDKYNLPDEWIQRICKKIDVTIESEKRNKRYNIR